MFNKGSEALSWEPYTGRKPSPSPDYPQEITKIEKIDCTVVGKNLFDLEKAKNLSYWSGDDDDAYRHFTGIELEPNSIYFLSVSQNNMYKDYNVEYNGNFAFYVGETKNVASPNKLFGNAGTSKINVLTTYTIRTSDKQFYLNLFVQQLNQENLNIVFNELLINLQIEKGSTATAYEPYQSQHVQFTPPAPLYSILDGSVADYVDVARGKYVYQLTDVTFDGSEDEAWGNYTGGGSDYDGVLIRRTDMKVGLRQRGFCDKLAIAQSESSSSSSTTTAWLGVNNNYIYLPHANTFAGTTNTTEFKTWLATNNLRFIYPLATATEQDIPTETLEALQALKTFNGVTNIFCNAPVSAQYEQSVQIVINKILEQLTSLQTQTLSLQEEMINNV